MERKKHAICKVVVFKNCITSPFCYSNTYTFLKYGLAESTSLSSEDNWLLERVMWTRESHRERKEKKRYREKQRKRDRERERERERDGRRDKQKEREREREREKEERGRKRKRRRIRRRIRRRRGEESYLSEPLVLKQWRTQRGFEGVHQIQLGVWGALRAPQRGPGRSPGRF